MRIARPGLSSSIKSAAAVANLPARRRVSAAGLVICRQRPGTASGVVFITMEDEHGFVNLIVYSRIFDAFRHVATAFPLLLAHGLIEREGKVIYVGSSNFAGWDIATAQGVAKSRRSLGLASEQSL